MKGLIMFDGGSRGNPGPAASAACLWVDERLAAESGKYIGISTNNVAEYRALLIGIDLATGHGVSELEIRGDSLLVVSHVAGSWACRSENLKPLLDKIKTGLRGFDCWTIEHVRRALNGHADALVNMTLDERAIISSRAS